MATMRILLSGEFMAAHTADALAHPDGRLHRYFVRVTLEYPDDGAPVNWDALSAALDGRLALLEHKLLTGVPGLAGVTPEAVARFLLGKFTALGPRVASVEVGLNGGASATALV